jgi:FeS assembly SUF system regulator
MLRISKLTDYATVILSYLALDSSKVMSATAIAKIVHLNVPTVSKILKMLTESGLVNSFRGTGGGYQLARRAEDITLTEVVSAIEGEAAMTECCAPKNTCVLDSLCAIKENWQTINKIIWSTLSGLTLSDMTKPLLTYSPSLRGIPVKTQGV